VDFLAHAETEPITQRVKRRTVTDKRRLQRRALELAFDSGADRKAIAAALELAKDHGIVLTMVMTAMQMIVRTAVKDSK
jgi:predicted hydrolase (HD superfamily)